MHCGFFIPSFRLSNYYIIYECCKQYIIIRMCENIELPKPFLFNCIKHHARYIKSRIELLSKRIDLLAENLLIIGESQMDLYLGQLSPSEICAEVKEKLRQCDALDRSKYSQWLQTKGKDYKTITLSDTSAWTLRHAEDEQHYVHIHPARYSPHTIRVKALTLKTAIAVLVYSKKSKSSPLDLTVVNYVRKEILFESPVKSLKNSASLIKVMNLLA